MQVHNEFNGTDRLAGSDACASRVGIALAFVIAIGFALRIAYLISVLRAPGFVWGDPDGYLDHALLLARGPHGWHWTFDAVKYEIKGQVHALPPLYTVFLSVIALFPGLPQTAQLAQVLVSTAAIFVMFQLGRLIHSTSAGLWAAGAYAVSVPAIFAVWSTQQETVYIPLLLLAFWLLARAIATNARPAAFAAAGLAFGLAALTRSMPVFFILPAAAVYVAMATDRRSALIQALGFVAGFAIVTGAYSAALSREFDQFTFIDSHGSIHLRAENDAGRAPGFTAAAAALWREIARSPQTYFEH
jgi:hypothetical protein